MCIKRYEWKKMRQNRHFYDNSIFDIHYIEKTDIVYIA